MTMPLHLAEDPSGRRGQARRLCRVDLRPATVVVQGARYVESSPILHAQALHPGRILKALPVSDLDAPYDLILVDPEHSQIEDEIVAAFRAKYREPVRIFIHLRPTTA